MSLKGQYLEPLAPTSPEFLQYQAVFGAHMLAKLYKIVYETVGTHSLDQFNLYPSIFFHGTGHCGCVNRGTSTDLTNIDASNWCSNACATQGILNHGHLRAYSRGGHFFSPNWGTAQIYCVQKARHQAYMSMFLVKARYNNNQNADICSVQNDTDILPCFLAVLRYP